MDSLGSVSQIVFVFFAHLRLLGLSSNIINLQLVLCQCAVNDIFVQVRSSYVKFQQDFKFPWHCSDYIPFPLSSLTVYYPLILFPSPVPLSPLYHCVLLLNLTSLHTISPSTLPLLLLFTNLLPSFLFPSLHFPTLAVRSGRRSHQP